jgi:hypothetical protein
MRGKFVDQRPKLHGLGAEFELPGLNLGEVEHLVDEAEQAGSGAMHALKRLL